MTIILGLGNPLMGDDGVGIVAVERLAALDLPPGVEVVDGGTGGLTLLHLMEGAARVIFVDAVDMGRAPGAIACFDLNRVDVAEQGALSLHETGLPQVLALGRELGVLPRVILYGVQPACVAPGTRLSPNVKDALPELVGRILREVGEHAILFPMQTEILEQLKAIPAGWQRRLYFMGVLGEVLAPAGVRPVIVGGNAVEFYTLGGYATADIDLVVAERAEVDRCLAAMGFTREGRHWFSEELDLAVEIPGSALAGDPERVTEVEIDGRLVYLIGLEDLIIDRLNALVHWRSARDGEWAEQMLALHFDEVDFDYLRRRAQGEGVGDALQAILNRMEP
ncbi:hydrogenase maturation protease [Geoalkalibacter halelectricus]|uniref:Hydrogenase maturation protease n=1 Tax=Geoalkalibacter halelectricus TaxID=2847045 RepID=A0ABY5ZN24_9BACT|nr:hydrogenase maturation protease [Geoalkalibacter halelectricus]MDO3377755.1 hydrogenase maturation protease [Geoalkalibacter halelectricus]UWZ78651.1 hydrogenase maturation protease [Geoalkalibacter halelectricus]